MGKIVKSGIATGTSGSKQLTFDNEVAKLRNMASKKITAKQPIFSAKGHVTFESIEARAEFFMGKSVAKLENTLQKKGYTTTRRPSKYSKRGSKAKIIVVTNSNIERNITQVQVSKNSKRHGNVPYVKISTNDLGIIKIVNGTEQQYKTDGKEKAKIIFRRYKNGKNIKSRD